MLGCCLPPGFSRCRRRLLEALIDVADEKIVETLLDRSEVLQFLPSKNSVSRIFFGSCGRENNLQLIKVFGSQIGRICSKKYALSSAPLPGL